MISFSASTNDSKFARESVEYPKILEIFKRFLSFVVNREARLGLQKLRNTACMMGILGKGNPDDLHESARHKTADSCNRCEHDNAIFLALLKTLSGNQETLYLVHVWVSNHVDHRKNTSLTNFIASSESAFEVVSLKFQANNFFKNHLKVESKLLVDLKYSMRNYGFTKSAINELDYVLLPFDPAIQARAKDLFHKVVNEHVKIACDKKDMEETTSNLGADKIGDLPRRKKLNTLGTKKN